MEQQYFFFYDWEITYDQQIGANIPHFPATKSAIIQEARNRLLSLRNLCEDLVSIKELLAEDIGLCADIEVSPGTDLEELQAEIFCLLETHVKPPVHFYTLDEMLTRGYSTDIIFEGPTLDHGFIDPNEFDQIDLKKPIRASDILQLIMDLPGVLAVRNLSMVSYIDGDRRCVAPWLLCPDEDPCRLPNFSPLYSSMVFYVNGLPAFANKNKVQQLVQIKEAEAIILKHKDHDGDLPIPVGEDMELGDFFPVQNDLPLNYLVGQYRVPLSETSKRKAQARQLKGFLLFFEQLFANYLAQLAHVHELFSWENSSEIRTYFTQRLNEHEIADLPELYKDYANLQVDLNSIIEQPEEAYERKQRFLEHLIARFGESFTEYSLLMYQQLGNNLDTAQQIINAQQQFLQNLPQISSERGQAYDYRYPEDPDNLSGLQRRVYHLMGIEDVSRRMFAGDRLQLIQGENGQWYIILATSDDDDTPIFTSIACPSQAAIASMLDFLLLAVYKEWVYLFETEHCDEEWQLWMQCENEPKQLVGTLRGEEDKEVVMAYLREYAKSEGFHVIEHILLRKRQEEDPMLAAQTGNLENCCPEVLDPYSFRATIVLPAWSPRFQDLTFRRWIEDTLRLEAPAHVLLKICWIGHEAMRELEECLEKWECELALLDPIYSSVKNEDGNFMGEPSPQYEVYRIALAALIEKLETLENIFPPARLHDCESAGSDHNEFILGQNNLRTL